MLRTHAFLLDPLIHFLHMSSEAYAGSRPYTRFCGDLTFDVGLISVADE